MRPPRFLYDNTNPNSVASRLRRKRFGLVRRLLAEFPQPVRVLDVGGTESYWKALGSLGEINIDLTILNLHPGNATEQKVRLLQGDARDLSFAADGEYDLVLSNSVIEHVGDWDDQMRMAREIRRVGKAYCVQTPNYWFPIEPHFVFPFFQYLPISVRIWLVRHFRLGWHQRYPDDESARRAVAGIRLRTYSEMCRLFPGATVVTEKFLGMSKSFVAHGRTTESPGK